MTVVFCGGRANLVSLADRRWLPPTASTRSFGRRPCLAATPPGATEDTWMKKPARPSVGGGEGWGGSGRARMRDMGGLTVLVAFGRVSGENTHGAAVALSR